jgi:hypothetical protein
MFVMWKVLFERLKSVQILTITLLELEPLPYTSVALMAQYLNVRQRKLGTIIIQTVHILQNESCGHRVTALEGFSHVPTLITSDKPSPAVVP